MKHKQQQIKENLKITCSYQKDGADVGELIKQSFKIFAKSELIKSCA